MMESLEIDGLTFELRRSQRRRTLGLTVDRSGELVAHAPDAVPVEEVSRWIRTKLLWVHRKLALKEEMAPTVKAPEFISGEGFSYLGKRYRLKIEKAPDADLAFDGVFFRMRAGLADPTIAFRHWYHRAGEEWIRKRVVFLSSKAGVSPKTVEVRDLGFNWGSCSKSGTIYFNWKLLQLPVKLIDYVIMHELIHLQEHHHGPAFWQALERAMSDWKTRKEELAGRAKRYLRFGLSR